MKLSLRVILFTFAISLTAIADENPNDIIKALSSVNGITYREVLVAEDPAIPAGYRRFEIKIEQEVDHFQTSKKFTQRLALLHKSLVEPMVLQTSGYKIFSVKLSALAKAFSTNQLQVEHRFFEQAAPAILEWNKLDILQSANDFHRVTETFRKIYHGHWINTGASKGGMTSSYHRRFFPNDLDGTVADVAPLSYTTEDKRYIDFVNQAGGEHYHQCRESLRSLQIAMLQRRDELLPHFFGSFFYLGGKSVGFEHAVIELPFTFWQYQNPEDPYVGCAKIPTPASPADDMANFLQAVNAPYDDKTTLTFMPYFFQAATQLGSPAAELAHLNAYRLHDYSVLQYTPPGVNCPYTKAAMLDVENWVRTEADQILFVYGEFDPWSAAAYPTNGRAKDFQRLFVPGGNHGSNLFALDPADKEKALTSVRRWLGKNESQMDSFDTRDTLDAIEFRMRKKLGLM